MNSSPVLEIRGISKSFGIVKALKEVSMDIKPGEVVGLVGENGSGKSTMMNIITGNLQPDGGTIILEGQEVRFKNPLEAMNSGIGIVHQEIANCPDISVAENIFINEIVASRKQFINYRKLYKRAAEQLKMFGRNIDPQAKISTLTISEQQVVEIAKALTVDAKLIIFDEPTSSLTSEETEKLIEIILGLKERGIAIIYISHRMEEVYRLTDRVIVLRDGCYIDQSPTSEVNNDWIVTKMTGYPVNEFCPPKAEEIGPVVLEVRDFNRPGVFENINFDIHKGEILGFSGLIGAGRSELMKSIVGLDKKKSGQLVYDGKPLKIRQYSQAVNQGILYLTEDRKQDGLFLRMSVEKNLSLLNLNLISGKFFVNGRKELEEASVYSQLMNVRCSGLDQIVGTLSGGNQQKVMIASALSVHPKVIILDEPTRGIDVGAKAEIYRTLRDLTKQGVAVVVISSELAEVISLCDRVCVMYEGSLRGELTGDKISENNIMRLASGMTIEA